MPAHPSANPPCIVTLTVNPAIDGACETEKIQPIRKIRTSKEHFTPGGGGVNVTRVIHELGGQARALYMAGGATGPVLDALIERLGLDHHTIPIAGDTRISQVVFERSSGLEYRFVPEGPTISERECAACLAAIEDTNCDYLVASGSLAPGMPNHFYTRVQDIAARKGAKFVLDTSGDELKASLARGGVHLVKPSIGEFESLIGRKLGSPAEQDEAIAAYARTGAVDYLTVTLGRDGAVFADREGLLRLKSPEVETKSAVGAGDSFVGAMTYALALGRRPREAFAYGVAAGTAAVLRQGPYLCDRADVERLYAAITRGVAL
ncbi:MAG: 1-phosphofructokinase family hexose kinase [Beijerinckiaceae bacterium]|nr:1-phosphofructokinase family hexose kinase [Beijerinckiaceae bacterium]